ncbi:interleukin-17 receptor E-like protein isoform X2 [Ascaphus truei]|uniref:interleukin-17 receptor E-like protein isoform X2 n=1 Tax=Ascaphus truei TaxID=8439 RepID=UPI003F59C66A
MHFHKDKCCFLYWKIAGSRFFIVFIFGFCNCHSIQRIEECGLTCSQRNLCKSKPTTDILNLFCRDPPPTLSPAVLENMKIATAMKCNGKNQCSLYLNIKGNVILDENIRGVEICSMTLSTSQNQCTSVTFFRKKAKKSDAQRVQVRFNCFEVGVAQHVYVTMKTIPYFCNVELEQHYHVEDCQNRDVGKNIFTCIAGKLDYMVDEGRKSITVQVSDILEEHDYHVRLCLKHYSCQDIGAHALIKIGDSTKSVTLPYSELLPCLCIEGWSAIPDSRRVRLCPFKNDTSALWNSITYNPTTQVLAWQPSCPVQATVNLCWLTEQNNKCVNLPNSLSTEHDKVSYTQVDTHPRLCMKFTTHMDSWVRCPFAQGQFPGWDMKIAVIAELVQIRIMSQIKAKFSVLMCNRTQLTLCKPIQIFASVYVGASEYVTLNLSRDICSPNICIQGWRTDVNYSIPVQLCNIPCKPPLTLFDDENTLQMLMMAAVLLILVIMVAFAGYVTLTVHYQKQLEQKSYLKAKVKQYISSGIASSLEHRVSILFAKADDD